MRVFVEQLLKIPINDDNMYILENAANEKG